MATTSLTTVDNDATELILCTRVAIRFHVIAVYYFSLQFCKSRYGVRFHVKIPWKLKVIIKLDRTHSLKVILESLQLNC